MMTNVFAAIDIFNLNLGACIAFLGIAALLVVLFLLVRCRVTYIDSEDGSVIHEEKHTWFDKVDIHAANKVGKRLIGWSKVQNGKKPLVKHKVVLNGVVSVNNAAVLDLLSALICVLLNT